MFSLLPLIFSSSSVFSKHLWVVPNLPIRINIIIFMFHGFNSSQEGSNYLIIISFSFIFTLWSVGTIKSTKWHILLIPVVINTRSGLLTGTGWFDCISKSRWNLWASFSRTYFVLCIYHVLVWSNFNLFHNSQWITFLMLSCLVCCSFELVFSIVWINVSSLSKQSLAISFSLQP